MHDIPPRIKEFLTQIKESPVKVEVKVGGFKFTRQQATALTLISIGFSLKEAAMVMGISVKTFEKHIQLVRDITGQRTIVALTHFSIKHNLVQAGEHVGNLSK